MGLDENALLTAGLEILRDSVSSGEFKLLEAVDRIPEGDPTGVVLATIDGPVLDYLNGSRNGGRLYEEELCDDIHASDYVAEMNDTKTFLGEPDHPMKFEDRLDIHFPYVSHGIRNFRKVPQEGKYYATFDILDTPNGRILFTLLKYGCKLGASSRGAGKVINKGGRQVVDPLSYKFVTFDIVAMPGNKVARLSNPTKSALGESVDFINPSEALLEVLNEGILNNDDSKVASVKMLINHLDSNYSKKLTTLLESYQSESNPEVKGITNADFEKDLLEAYDRIATLKKSDESKDLIIKGLQEKLNQSESRNRQLNESVDLEKKSRQKLIDNFNIEKSQLLESHQRSLSDKEVSLTEQFSKIESQLRRSLKDKISEINQLYESLNEQDTDRLTINEKASRLSNRVGLLNESLQSKDSEIESLQSDLNESYKIAESYFDNYVRTRCSQLGLNESSVKDLIHLGDDITSVEKVLSESFRLLQSRSHPIVESRRQPIKVVGRTLNESLQDEEEDNRRKSYDDNITNNVGALKNE